MGTGRASSALLPGAWGRCRGSGAIPAVPAQPAPTPKQHLLPAPSPPHPAPLQALWLEQSRGGEGGPGGQGDEPSRLLAESAPERQASAPEFLSGAHPASRGHGPGLGWGRRVPPLVSLREEKWALGKGRTQQGRGGGPRQHPGPQRRKGQHGRGSLDLRTAPGAGDDSEAGAGLPLGASAPRGRPRGRRGWERIYVGPVQSCPKH